MKLHRFYVPESLGSDIFLQVDALVHQLKTVFRMEAGDSIVLFNSDGLDRVYTIDELSKKHLRAHASGVTQASVLPHVHVTVCLAQIRKERFEWALEKMTELGVSHVVPLVTDRTERSSVKLERAQKIVQEAAEQCGRGDVPTIEDPQTIPEILKKYPDALMCDISGVPMSDLNTKYLLPTTILIGPEGGWTPQEMALFEKHGVKKISLGRTTLRAETAAMIAVSQCMR